MFEQALGVIARNRKLLLDKFKLEHKRSPNVTCDAAKEIIGEVLQLSGIRLSDKNFQQLIQFAEKNGIVDYRFLMEVFKQRNQQTISAPPK